MARTRGASGAFHQDDGELLDKDGKPIPTEPVRPALIHMDDGEIGAPPVKAVEPPPRPLAWDYLCDRTTWARDMGGFEALLILEVATGAPLTMTLSRDKWAMLPPDARRHFRRVPAAVVAEEEDC
jgi:hypothetical protein